MHPVAVWCITSLHGLDLTCGRYSTRSHLKPCAWGWGPMRTPVRCVDPSGLRWWCAGAIVQCRTCWCDMWCGMGWLILLLLLIWCVMCTLGWCTGGHYAVQHSVCGVTRIISIDPCYIHSPVSHLFTLAVHIHSYHTYSVSLCTFTHIISIHPGCIHSFLSYLFTLAAHIHCNHIYSVVLYTFTHVISVKHCCIHSFLSYLLTLAAYIHSCHTYSVSLCVAEQV